MIEEHIELDLLFVIPHQKCNGIFVDNIKKIKEKSGCKVALINFETPNWYNENPGGIRRPEEQWNGWGEIAKESQYIISSCAISKEYAIKYKQYKESDSKHLVYNCPINTTYADKNS